MISVKWDVAKATRFIDEKYRRQIPFATALALTRTAQDAQRTLTEELPKVFDRPTPFTMRAFGFSPANKATLTAKVFIRDIQAAYLKLQVEGGTRRPQRRALVLPAEIDLNQYGNLPRRRIKQLLARKDTFSGSIRGVAGIWQRTRKGGLKLLIAYEPQAKYQKRLPFEPITRRVVGQRFNINFSAALSRAIASAR